MPGIANRIISDLVNRVDGIDDIYEEVESILDMTNTVANIAVTDTETTLYIDDSPTQIINGVSIMVDLSVIEAADTFDFKVYYRLASGGTLKASEKVTKAGVIAEPIYIINLDTYRYGIKITAQRTGGTNRTFPIAVFREI